MWVALIVYNAVALYSASKKEDENNAQHNKLMISCCLTHEICYTVHIQRLLSTMKDLLKLKVLLEATHSFFSFDFFLCVD